MTESVHSFVARTIDGREQHLDAYKGKVLLIVNTASHCGFTPQYTELQQLHERFEPRGFAVLGFPCNQFGNQEPGTNDSIQQFCEIRYGVTFPLFAKVDVNGDNTDPLFRHLKQTARGLLGSQDIKWNFTKFLVDDLGKAIRRYGPSTRPSDVATAVEALICAREARAA
ncbi:MAG: glutathione peroxidase [Polyangiaceae bacterium]|jgi:glutathione peroxidase|nr:glutathione peroxidase [Polyangiaceae bacterium]